jgi:cysteine desulfurase/selenocysteine lyase
MEQSSSVQLVSDRCRALRPDFPVLSRTLDGHPLTYLDSAATSLKPWAVIDEVRRYYTSVGANIHRGKHMLSEEASAHYETVRYRVAQFAGCRGNELVFLRNTTEAINLLATGLGLTGEDLVLVPLDTHHSQLLPWQRVARVALIRPDPGCGVDLDHYAELLRRRPAVVAIPVCSNVSGIYLPVEQMAAAAKQAGATVVLDAAQSVPHRPLRFTDSGADFAAFSGHKMLGPTGIGVLVGKYERLAGLATPLIGGGTVDWVTTDHHDSRKVPHRFEAGTPDIAGVYGLGAAVDYLERVGMEVVSGHDRELGRVLHDQVASRDWLVPVGGTAAPDRAAIVSLGIPEARNIGDVARVLSDSYGVMSRSGHLCAQPFIDDRYGKQVLRLSGYLYNTPEEITAAFTALDELRSVW